MSNGRHLNIQLPEFLSEGEAACSTVDPEIFFPQGVDYTTLNGPVVAVYTNLKQAKAICESCDLRARCLEYALKNDDIGIWGGLTESQRKNLRRKVGIAMPRRQKTPNLW